MHKRISEQPLAQVVIALVVALIFSPVVSSVTTELSQTMGRAWPFSLEHRAARPGSVDDASASTHWASR